MAKGLEGKIHDWMGSSLFSLEKRRLSGELMSVYIILTTKDREGGTDLFSLVSSDRTQENDMEL